MVPEQPLEDAAAGKADPRAVPSSLARQPKRSFHHLHATAADMG
jgi:hypothetical protein